MSFFDFMDDWVWGPFNWFERGFGFTNRLVSPSKGGRFGPTVEIRIRRMDKGGKIPFRSVVDHLRRYGVNTFDHGYNSQYQWFSVRKTQIKFAEWLYNGGNLRTPRRAWRDAP